MDGERCELKLEAGKPGHELSGVVHARSGDGQRSYQAALSGEIEVTNGRITRFDLVARGVYRGHGRYTGNGAPEGGFTLAVAFALAAADDPAAVVPPQGARWLPGYLKADQGPP